MSFHLIEPLLIRLLINGNARENQAALCAKMNAVLTEYRVNTERTKGLLWQPLLHLLSIARP